MASSTTTSSPSGLRPFEIEGPPSRVSSSSSKMPSLASISHMERLLVFVTFTLLTLIVVGIITVVIVYRSRIRGMINTVEQIQNQYEELQPTINEAQSMIDQLNTMQIVPRANCVLADTQCAISLFKDPVSCAMAALPPCGSPKALEAVQDIEASRQASSSSSPQRLVGNHSGGRRINQGDDFYTYSHGHVSRGKISNLWDQRRSSRGGSGRRRGGPEWDDDDDW